MKVSTFIPSICKGEGAEWAGFIKMNPLSFDEKFGFIEEIGGEQSEDNSGKIKQTRAMVKMSLPKYVEVDLKNTKTGEHVKSVEDMQYCSDLHPVLIEAAASLFSGAQVGNG